MKKSLNLLALLASVAIMAMVSTGKIHARLTGTTGTAETCWGAAGAEICIDTSGNWIPTTDNDTTLGLSSLRWATVYSYDEDIADDLTVSDDVRVLGDLFNVPLATQTLAAGGTIDLTGACGKLVRVAVTANRTTDTTHTFTTPTSAGIGCSYMIVNVGGGTITLDDNIEFDVPANVVLGTNDGALIVQVGAANYVLLGTSDN